MTLRDNAFLCSQRALCGLILVLGLAPNAAWAVVDEVSYQRDIRPILSDHCFRCHGPDSAAREGDLRLDQSDSALVGGDSGEPAIVSGRPNESELIRRILSEDESEQMPPPEMKHPLNATQKQRLVEWIESGGRYDEHWSFVPVDRPATPLIQAADWGNNPIDFFVAARLSQSRLQPNPPADRYQIVRRLYLEITGLPPTPVEADAFVQDVRPDAIDRLVDRLLASPHYGERMAWNWLDAARYADSNGYQGDGDRTMWPWRDWVVESMNEDLRFDQFTIWQIAGDLLPNATREQRLATGFFRNHMINGEGGRIPEENRIDYVMDMTETLGTVWLGLTFNCCRCHDHKYDPLLRKDYYSLFAFFNQTPIDGSGGNPQTPPVLEVPSPSQSMRLTELEAGIEQAFVGLEAWQKEQVDNETNAEESDDKVVPMRQRSRGQWQQWLQESPDLPPEIIGQTETLIAAMESREKVRNALPKVMVMADRADLRKTFLLSKGLYNEPEDETLAATPARFAPLSPEQPVNRLGLALWLVADDQPLMARVTVNRLWQQVFGVGLVKTVENLGTQGEWPSHPDLIDWLAVEFRRGDWSTKRLLRTILLSATYQQSSNIDPAAIEWDPHNRLLSHGPRFRMPSWMIRDQALAVSGLIDQRLGGPPINPYQPSGVWQDATFGKRTYQISKGSDLYRRSVYVFWRRIIAPTMFFDSASRQTCTVNLNRTNTPLHALTILNSETYIEASRVLAERIVAESPDAPVERWIESAFRQMLIRPVEPDELDLLRSAYIEFLAHFIEHPEEVDQLLSVGQAPIRADRERDGHRVAALTALCNGLFNVDETLSKE